MKRYLPRSAPVSTSWTRMPKSRTTRWTSGLKRAILTTERLRFDTSRAGQLLELCQSHSNDLIHVEVAIIGKPADEAHARFPMSQLLVSPIERSRFLGRQWIKRLFSSAKVSWVFSNDRGDRNLLPGDMLRLHNSREFEIVRVIYLYGWLIECLLERFGFETQRPVRKWPESPAEILINWTRVD